MSKSDNILAFEAALKMNKELQDIFSAEKKRIVEDNEASSYEELMAKAAAKLGFFLTMEEFGQSMVQAKEITDEALTKVSGGYWTKGDTGFDPYFCPLDAMNDNTDPLYTDGSIIDPFTDFLNDPSNG